MALGRSLVTLLCLPSLTCVKGGQLTLGSTLGICAGVALRFAGKAAAICVGRPSASAGQTQMRDPPTTSRNRNQFQTG
eukprot:4537352-Amphidinium_carterae.1